MNPTNTPAHTANPFCLVERVNPCGTGLVGYVKTTYAMLLFHFGPPHGRKGDKTTVEWGYLCADGTRFTIYDWKESATPLELYRWHIGGNTARAIEAFNTRTGLGAYSAF
jgi:hypothetical protein